MPIWRITNPITGQAFDLTEEADASPGEGATPVGLGSRAPLAGMAPSPKLLQPLLARAPLVQRSPLPGAVATPVAPLAPATASQIGARLAGSLPGGGPAGALQPLQLPSADRPAQPLVFVRRRRPRVVAPPPAPEPPSAPSPFSALLGPHAAPSREVADDPGLPLSDEQRATLEPTIGAGLTGVRLHTDTTAARLASALSAEAFTVGRDIFFNRGKYEPWSPRGQALLAHELVHVRQQMGTAAEQTASSANPEAAEREAEAVERRVMERAPRPMEPGLSVGRHDRHYRSADRQSLTPADRARLDGISVKALDVCKRLVSSELNGASPGTIRGIQVDIHLNLAAMTDEQAADVWGRALAEQLRAQLRENQGPRPLLPPVGLTSTRTLRRSPETSKPRPHISKDTLKLMRSDVDQIISILQDQWVSARNERQILAIIARWSTFDDDLRSALGFEGTPYYDRFLLMLKTTTFTRRTIGSMGVQQYALVFDAIWRDMDGDRLQQLKTLLARSQGQNATGPSMPPPENPWATIGKQEAIGLWGMLKGMGTGLAGTADAGAEVITGGLRFAHVDVADPINLSKWLAKQYDISGEAMFGKDYDQGNSAKIGSFGGGVIMSLVTLGAGGPEAKAAKWASVALAGMGVAGSLKAIYDSADGIAKLILKMQSEGTLSIKNLLTSGEFWEEATKLGANIVGAVAGGGSSKNEAERALQAGLAKAGIYLNAAQASAGVGRLIEIGASDLPDAKKKEEMAKVVENLISLAFTSVGQMDVAARQREADAARAGAKKGPSSPHEPSHAAARNEPPRAGPPETPPEPGAGSGEPRVPPREPRSAEAETPVAPPVRSAEREAAAARQLIARFKDWRGGLRKAVLARGEAGEAWAKPLADARRELVDRALAQVKREFPSVGFRDVGTAGFTSDIDVTFAPKTPPSASEPASVAAAVRESGLAAQRFTELLRAWTGGEPDVTLDTNAYTYTGIEASTTAPAQQAATAQAMDVVSLAEILRSMEAHDGSAAQRSWEKFKRQAIKQTMPRPAPGGEVGGLQAQIQSEVRARLLQQFAEAEAMVGRVRAAEHQAERQLTESGHAPAGREELSARARADAAAERRKALVEALEAQPIDFERVRRLQLEIKLLEPGAYATQAAIQDVVQHQQTSRGAERNARPGEEVAMVDPKTGERTGQTNVQGAPVTDPRELAQSATSSLAQLTEHLHGPLEEQLKAVVKYGARIEHALEASGAARGALPEFNLARDDVLAGWTRGEGRLTPEMADYARAYIQKRYEWAKQATIRLRVQSLTRAAAMGEASPGSGDQNRVWVNTRSGIYHTEGSPYYGRTKEGRWMTEREARAAGYRASKHSLGPAHHGTAEQAMITKALRPYEGTGGPWRLEKVERTVGGTKRVDELYINDEAKQILVVDNFTGEVESAAHERKGWDYMKEPEIQKYIAKGYQYWYKAAMKHPIHLH